MSLNYSIESLIYIILVIFVLPYARVFIKDTLKNFDDRLMGNRLTDEEENEILERLWKYLKGLIFK